MSKSPNKDGKSSHGKIVHVDAKHAPTSSVEMKSITWILGVKYDSTSESTKRAHVRSMARWTYRRDFKAMDPYTWLTSDAGWGCMLRSAQMLVSCAYQRHYLGQDWRVPLTDQGTLEGQTLRDDPTYCSTVRLFLDHPGEAAHMYALHNMVVGGLKYDKLPGEWFGPSTAALVMRDLSRLHRRLYRGPIEIVVSQGDVLYISDVEKACTQEPFHTTEDAAATDDATAIENQSVDAPNSEVDQSETTIATVTDGTIHSSSASVVSEPSPNVNFIPSGSSSDSVDDKCCSSAQRSEAAMVRKVEEQINSLLRLRAVYRNHRPSSSQPSVGRSSISVQQLPSSSSDSGVHALSSANGPQNSSPEDEFFDPLLRPPPQHSQPWKCALVVCVPLRLGEHSIESTYIEELKEHLRSPYSIGFIGGRVNHALYFMGYSERKNESKGAVQRTFLGLDPHTCYVSPSAASVRLADPQSTAAAAASSVTTNVVANRKSDSNQSEGWNPLFPTDEFLNQIHSERIDEIDYRSLDPSLTLGYYFRNREEFDSFCVDMQLINKEKLAKKIRPLFTIDFAPPVNSPRTYGYEDEEDFDTTHKDAEDEDDEYVFI